MAELGLQWQGRAGKSLWARKMESTSAWCECRACDSAALVKMHTVPSQCGQEIGTNAEAECLEDDDPLAIV